MIVLRNILIRSVIVVTFVGLCNICLGQSNSATSLLTQEQLKNTKIYYSLSDALKNPLDVYVLDLSGQKLKSIPKSIGQLKNLQSLNLSFKTREDCPKNILRKSKKVGGGLIHLDRLTGKYIDYNQLSALPEEIATLKNLQEINLGYNDLSESPMILQELEHLKMVNLVGCYGLIDKKEELENLKNSLPKECVLFSDVRFNRFREINLNRSSLSGVYDVNDVNRESVQLFFGRNMESLTECFF